ncbi:hypothetical protein DERP_009891 [Dermatophagoides pteronyssinus]|uniref:Uncharacterized protein n=1 Tax=Dermatophagoides pteronyssinus TaxID=6956 RepID=A0ABQ8J1V4_DERPT|nr:hypothetical protein DERP_009891 [Dermatophagoides pteronyssinus]
MHQHEYDYQVMVLYRNNPILLDNHKYSYKTLVEDPVFHITFVDMDCIEMPMVPAKNSLVKNITSCPRFFNGCAKPTQALTWPTPSTARKNIFRRNSNVSFASRQNASTRILLSDIGGRSDVSYNIRGQQLHRNAHGLKLFIFSIDGLPDNVPSSRNLFQTDDIALHGCSSDFSLPFFAIICFTLAIFNTISLKPYFSYVPAKNSFVKNITSCPRFFNGCAKPTQALIWPTPSTAVKNIFKLIIDSIFSHAFSFEFARAIRSPAFRQRCTNNGITIIGLPNENVSVTVLLPPCVITISTNGMTLV